MTELLDAVVIKKKKKLLFSSSRRRFSDALLKGADLDAVKADTLKL